MTPHHTRKAGRLYRYYVSMNVIKEGADACPVGRVPAAQVETAVIDKLRVLLRTPEIVGRAWQAARQNDPAIVEQDMIEALAELDPLWDELFPVEQARIIQLLVARIDISLAGLHITLRMDGLAQLAGELHPAAQARNQAA
jgi:hypothetical protein